MQRFSNSSVFSSRSNRFNELGPTFKSNSIKSILVDKGFESKNSSDYFFTNFFNSDQQQNYEKIKALYNKVIKNDYTFINKEYICDELYDNGNVIERLIDIINFNTNYKITKNDINHIYKLKCKDNRKLHIYISIENEVAKIVLIDLYHLSMPADIWDKGRIIKKGSLRQTMIAYDKFKRYSFNINNVIKS